MYIYISVLLLLLWNDGRLLVCHCMNMSVMYTTTTVFFIMIGCLMAIFCFCMHHSKRPSQPVMTLTITVNDAVTIVRFVVMKTQTETKIIIIIIVIIRNDRHQKTWK